MHTVDLFAGEAIFDGGDGHPGEFHTQPVICELLAFLIIKVFYARRSLFSALEVAETEPCKVAIHP